MVGEKSNGSTGGFGQATSRDVDDYSRLDALMDRIHQLTASPPSRHQATAETVAEPHLHPVLGTAPATHSDGWLPIEPDTLADAGLTEGEIEALILKTLNSRAEATGRYLADHAKLAFRIVDPILHSLKHDRLVAHKNAATMNDYVYQLTELGRERAKKFSEHCTYFGAAPVPLAAYIDSVKHQTLAGQHPSEEDLHRAFEDLLIDKRMLIRLGPAINSGRGMFLFGAPGNGKTSIAERITKAFGQSIWIPRAIGIDGDIMRLFDPGMHEEMPLPPNEGLIDHRKIDHRWVRIRRPTIVVGGELTMNQLEVTLNTNTNVSEAPVQLKSNCGTLVIDDFGRQRMTTDELLNRWIVPLEKRYDFLNLASGKKIQVPFDQLIVFSTNLEPKELVDDAFLRRIPYKIEVTDPDEQSFRQLLKIMADKLNVEYDESAVNYLIETHYRAVNRPLRCCQPRDLILQILNYCRYTGKPPKLTPENFDFAVENYFAVM
ncbi:MAG TPA: AAA family ATPase [Lacipirellulaceae bacterium]|nr:AAA family ATPase [Lacipirellulaceae bacterium]